MAWLDFSANPILKRILKQNQESVEGVEGVLRKALSNECQGSQVGDLHRVSQAVCEGQDELLSSDGLSMGRVSASRTKIRTSWAATRRSP